MTKEKETVDFAALIKDYSPHWYSRNPGELISFQDLQKKQPAHVCENIIRSFMKGNLSAFNPMSKMPARHFYIADDSSCFPNHLSGTFLNDYEGALEFEQPNEQINQFGTCELGYNFFSHKPYWFFTLHDHLLEDPSQISVGETVVLHANYKRIGKAAIPRSLQIFIKHEKGVGLLLSAILEGRHYRGINEGMIQSAIQFVRNNNIQAQPKEQHALLEEVIFTVCSLEEMHFPSTNVPTTYLKTQEAASKALLKFYFGLVFLKVDIQQLLHEPVSEHNNKQLEHPHNENSFTFKKHKPGYWAIDYCSESFEIPDKKGVKYIYFYIASPGKYFSLQEVYDAFDLTGDSNLNIDQTIYFDKIENQRTISQYEARIEKLKTDIINIKEPLSEAHNVEMVIITHAKELIEEKSKEIESLENEIKERKRGYEVRSKSNKDKGASVNIAIKRALELIEEESPDFANHLRESFVRREVRKRRGPGSYAERAYLPDMEVSWTLS